MSENRKTLFVYIFSAVVVIALLSIGLAFR